MTFVSENCKLLGGRKLVSVWLLCWSLALTYVAGESVVKAGYYLGGTSQLFPSTGLDSTLFTHLFYAFAGLHDQTSTVYAYAGNVNEMATFSAQMKSKNPNVLTLISVQVSGAQFGPVLQSNSSQNAFIASSISLARNNSFDGIDLDWEFAQSQQQMDEFGTFVALWRQAVTAEGQKTSRNPLLLTAAVYFSSTILYTGEGAYPVSAMAQNLDFVNIMTYDYHGSWDVTQTGANTNLYDPSSDINTDYGITSWLKAGLPSGKALLGLTLYGSSWVLKDQEAASGLGAPATAAGPAQPLSQSNGTFYYSEVVSFIAATNATVVHNETEVTGYCFANSVWVSYEDPVIVSMKVSYAESKGLGGYFFWEVSQDNDFQIATAASQAAENYGKTPNGVASRSSSSVLFLAVMMLISVLLLLRWTTADLVC